MEMHHGAKNLIGYYSPYFNPDNSDTATYFPLELTLAERSAIEGGRIIFSDDEDITKWPEHDKWYGPPLEIDAKYLDFILNTIEWQTTLSGSMSATVTMDFWEEPVSFTESSNFLIKGCYDNLYIEFGPNFLESYENGEYNEDVVEFTRYIISKRKINDGNVSQLEPKQYKVYSYRSVDKFTGAVEETTDPEEHTESRLNHLSILPRTAFLYDPDYWSNILSYDVETFNCNATTENSGVCESNFTLVHSDYNSSSFRLEGRVSVAYMLITPSKVYVWPEMDVQFSHANVTTILRSGARARPPTLPNPTISTTTVAFMGAQFQVPTYTSVYGDGSAEFEPPQLSYDIIKKQNSNQP
jgi:hypothetical protein